MMTTELLLFQLLKPSTSTSTSTSSKKMNVVSAIHSSTLIPPPNEEDEEDIVVELNEYEMEHVNRLLTTSIVVVETKKNTTPTSSSDDDDDDDDTPVNPTTNPTTTEEESTAVNVVDELMNDLHSAWNNIRNGRRKREDLLLLIKHMPKCFQFVDYILEEEEEDDCTVSEYNLTLLLNHRMNSIKTKMDFIQCIKSCKSIIYLKDILKEFLLLLEEDTLLLDEKEVLSLQYHLLECINNNLKEEKEEVNVELLSLVAIKGGIQVFTEYYNALLSVGNNSNNAYELFVLYFVEISKKDDDDKVLVYTLMDTVFSSSSSSSANNNNNHEGLLLHLLLQQQQQQQQQQDCKVFESVFAFYIKKFTFTKSGGKGLDVVAKVLLRIPEIMMSSSSSSSLLQNVYNELVYNILLQYYYPSKSSSSSTSSYSNATIPIKDRVAALRILSVLFSSKNMEKFQLLLQMELLQSNNDSVLDLCLQFCTFQFILQYLKRIYYTQSNLILLKKKLIKWLSQQINYCNNNSQVAFITLLELTCIDQKRLELIKNDSSNSNESVVEYVEKCLYDCVQEKMKKSNGSKKKIRELCGLLLGEGYEREEDKQIVHVLLEKFFSSKKRSGGYGKVVEYLFSTTTTKEDDDSSLEFNALTVLNSTDPGAKLKFRRICHLCACILESMDEKELKQMKELDLLLECFVCISATTTLTTVKDGQKGFDDLQSLNYLIRILTVVSQQEPQVYSSQTVDQYLTYLVVNYPESTTNSSSSSSWNMMECLIRVLHLRNSDVVLRLFQIGYKCLKQQQQQQHQQGLTKSNMIVLECLKYIPSNEHSKDSFDKLAEMNVAYILVELYFMNLYEEKNELLLERILQLLSANGSNSVVVLVLDRVLYKLQRVKDVSKYIALIQSLLQKALQFNPQEALQNFQHWRASFEYIQFVLLEGLVHPLECIEYLSLLGSRVLMLQQQQQQQNQSGSMVALCEEAVLLHKCLYLKYPDFINCNNRSCVQRIQQQVKQLTAGQQLPPLFNFYDGMFSIYPVSNKKKHVMKQKEFLLCCASLLPTKVESAVSEQVLFILWNLTTLKLSGCAAYLLYLIVYKLDEYIDMLQQQTGKDVAVVDMITVCAYYCRQYLIQRYNVQESKVLAFKPQSADVDLNIISVVNGSKDFNQLRQALDSVLELYNNKDHDNLRLLREEAINKTTRDYDLSATVTATSTNSAAPRRKSTGTAKPRAKKNKKIDSNNNESEDVKPNKRQRRKRRRRTVAAKLSDHDSDDEEQEQDDDNDSDFA